MDWLKVFEVSATVGKKAANWSLTDEGKKFLFGTYTDGKPRSMVDSMNDEILSPESRESRMRQVEKRMMLREQMMAESSTPKKKKGKKKKGKKNSKSKGDFWISNF